MIIVDNGELLLNASIHDIGIKLCFKSVTEIPLTGKVLYAEDSLKGHAVVLENTDQEDSKINLEHLFNAITENPIMAKSIFHN